MSKAPINRSGESAGRKAATAAGRTLTGTGTRKDAKTAAASALTQVKPKAK